MLDAATYYAEIRPAPDGLLRLGQAVVDILRGEAMRGPTATPDWRNQLNVKSGQGPVPADTGPDTGQQIQNAAPNLTKTLLGDDMSNMRMGGSATLQNPMQPKGTQPPQQYNAFKAAKTGAY